MRLHAVKAWYDAHEGMVEVEDDVLSIVRQVRELYGDRISIELDPHSGYYHFVGHGEDHTDYLIFTTSELDGRAMERLMLADSHSRMHQDPYDAVEREQDELMRARDEAQIERLRDGGERLAHALQKDGRQSHMPLQVAIPKDIPDA